MTIEQFQKVFPWAIALHYVERGPHGNRKFVWHAYTSCGYFTSDSDRLVNSDPIGIRDSGTGDTIEEALDNLVKNRVNRLQSELNGYSEESEKTKAKLMSIKTAWA